MTVTIHSKKHQPSVKPVVYGSIIYEIILRARDQRMLSDKGEYAGIHSILNKSVHDFIAGLRGNVRSFVTGSDGLMHLRVQVPANVSAGQLVWRLRRQTVEAISKSHRHLCEKGTVWVMDYYAATYGQYSQEELRKFLKLEVRPYRNNAVPAGVPARKAS